MGRSIYVVKSETGPIKIGIATDLKRRLSALRTSSPAQLSLEYAARCSDVAAAREIEISVHELLHLKRRNGEWFVASVEEAIDAITRTAVKVGQNLILLSLQELEGPRQRKKRPDQDRHDALCRQLKEKRMQSLLSQTQVAERLDWDQRVVSRLEVGAKQVTVLELISLAKALGFDAAGVIAEIEDV